MTEKFSIKAAGGFSLTSGLTGSPVFSGDGRFLAALIPGSRRIGVWDTVLRSQVLAGKASFPLPGGLTINHDGTRLAVRSDGRLEVLEVPSGKSIWSIRKNNLAEDDYQVLDAHGNRLFDASSGVQAGLMLWDVNSGTCLERHPFDGDKYMVSAISRSRDDQVAVCLMAKADSQSKESGFYDELWLHDGSAVRRIDLNLHSSTAVISPDGKKIFVAGTRGGGNAVFRLVDLYGGVLLEKAIGLERTFPNGDPVWRHDSLQIAWHTGDCNVAWLIDAETLSVKEKLIWPSIEVAFGQNDLVAMAGLKGVVLPSHALECAVAEIGQPAAEEDKHRQYACSDYRLTQNLSAACCRVPV